MRRPTIKRLREVLAYDAATGALTWRISPTSNVKVGDEAAHAAYVAKAKEVFGEFARAA